MRKLLEEAARNLQLIHDGEGCVLTPYGLEELGNLLARIDAALAAPEPDAEKLATAIIEAQHASDTYNDWVLNAAALIAGYGKRVSRAMLDDLYSIAFGTGQGSNLMLPEEAKSRILAKYGYRAE